MPEHCDQEHQPTGARCYKNPESYHGDMHTGWSHYPGQVISWRVTGTCYHCLLCGVTTSDWCPQTRDGEHRLVIEDE